MQNILDLEVNISYIFLDKILPKSFLFDFLAHQYIHLLGLKGKDFHNHDYDPRSKQLWFVSTSSSLFQLRWKRSEMTKFLISEHKQRKIQPETNKERKQSNNPKYSKSHGHVQC